MVKNYFNREKLFNFSGIALIFIGLAVNEWVLTKVMSNDGVLQLQNKIIIWFFQLLSIGLGFILIKIKKDVKLQMGLLVSLVTLIFGLGLLEFACKIIDKSEQWRIVEANPYGTGSYRLRPNFSMDLKNGDVVKMNSLGMHWREVSRENPSSKTRVAFVGDSFTFGRSADRVEHSFAGVFDFQLSSDKMEVLNFGVPGYGIDDMELMIKEEVLSFKPKYLFLMFFAGNDFSDTFLGVHKYDVAGNAMNPNDQVLEEKIPQQYRVKTVFFKSLLARSSIYHIMIKVVNSVKESKQAEKDVVVSDFHTSPIFAQYGFWSRYPYSDAALKAKDISLETLDRIHSMCQANQIQLIIVLIPYKEQVYATSIAGDGFDVRYPQKYVEDFAQENNISYLDLLPVLRDYVRSHEGNIYWYTDEHFNNKGHELVGELLVDFFKKDILKK